MRREYGLDPFSLSRYTLRELQALIDEHNSMTAPPNDIDGF